MSNSSWQQGKELSTAPVPNRNSNATEICEESVKGRKLRSCCQSKTSGEAAVKLDPSPGARCLTRDVFLLEGQETGS